MENIGLNAAGNQLGKAQHLTWKPEPLACSPESLAHILVCGSRQPGGRQCLFCSDNRLPQQVPCSGFGEQRHKPEASGRNSRRFEEENECYSCMKSQQQPDWGSLWLCLHPLGGGDWGGVRAADATGMTPHTVSGGGGLLGVHRPNPPRQCV